MRSTECSFYRPSALQPTMDGAGTHVEFTRPFADCHRPSLKRNRGDAAIMTLLGCCGPSTVIGRIRTIVVDSIKAVSGGLGSHIREEGDKAMAPPRAHCDAASAPIGVAGMLRVMTPPLHVAPSVVFGCLLAASVVPVCGALARGIGNQAPTTTARPAAKMTTSHVAGLTATAATEPHGLSAVVESNESLDGPTPERHSG